MLYPVIQGGEPDSANAEIVTPQPFDADKIRLTAQQDQGAFDRAVAIAQLLYENQFWLSDQLLYVDDPYPLHLSLFAFDGCPVDVLRSYLVQYAPVYASRRALYISATPDKWREKFLREQALEETYQKGTAPMEPAVVEVTHRLDTEFVPPHELSKAAFEAWRKAVIATFPPAPPVPDYDPYDEQEHNRLQKAAKKLKDTIRALQHLGDTEAAQPHAKSLKQLEEQIADLASIKEANDSLHTAYNAARDVWIIARNRLLISRFPHLLDTYYMVFRVTYRSQQVEDVTFDPRFLRQDFHKEVIVEKYPYQRLYRAALPAQVQVDYGHLYDEPIQNHAVGSLVVLNWSREGVASGSKGEVLKFDLATGEYTIKFDETEVVMPDNDLSTYMPAPAETPSEAKQRPDLLSLLAEDRYQLRGLVVMAELISRRPCLSEAMGFQQGDYCTCASCESSHALMNIKRSLRLPLDQPIVQQEIGEE